VIYNELADVQGFIGYLPSDESIYVTFKGMGSGSTANYYEWIGNLLVPYTEWLPECAGCHVHLGIYTAVKIVMPEIHAEVLRLQSEFPSYQTKTTGHSLGSNFAQLTAMSLLSKGVQVDQMLNFGQMR